ncbi:MAG: Rpn family recombination-promoting nuclease/putative transposase [Lachnospiraceae bacterium]|nr:Rpn family recombination-promoting nuclease/putative transposase [Lachnospiraceae bacterium]
MADLYNVLESSNGETQYDQYAKEIIAYKPILANILVHTVKEFHGQDPDDVIPLIENTILIGKVPVDPGFTNEKDAKGNIKIAGSNTESKVPNEGVRYFDILFYVNAPTGLSQVIINIEMQKSDPTEYDVEMRGIYYAAREISSQLERDFTKMDYNSIKKVYSIWICTNQNENSINKIHLTRNHLLGNGRWKDMYDVLNVVIIRMKNMLDKNLNHKLHRMLGAIFLDSLSIDQKKDILKEECNIDITDERREMLEDMCNLGEGIFERGVETGIQKGIEKGHEQGIIEGRELGIIESIKRLLLNGMLEDQIIQFLQVTPEQIEKAKANSLTVS